MGEEGAEEGWNGKGREGGEARERSEEKACRMRKRDELGRKERDGRERSGHE